MNVSFGKIKCFRETPNITNTQQYALNKAMRVFGPHPTIPFRYGVDPYSGMELSLDEALKEKRNADVFITCKKNGNIELKVMKPLPKPDKNGKTVYYIPTESYENRLVSEINPLPLNHLIHKLNKFARRCEYYVRVGNTGINKRIETEEMAKL